MKNKKSLSRQILLSIAFSAPLFTFGLKTDGTDADSVKKLLDFKKIIFKIDTYDDISEYDTNNNGVVNVFDVMRCKRNVYNITVCPPSETSQTTVTTTPPTDITQPTTATTTSPVTTITSVSSTTDTTVTTTSAPLTTTTATTTSAPPVTTVTTTTTPPPVTTEMPKYKMISNMKSILQGPELPTGCEATGLTTVIRWYGYDVSKMDIALKYMPSAPVYYSGGYLYGPDFITTFAGNPQTEGLSYGCYIPCLMTTANSYFSSVGSSYRAKNLTGTELEELFKYVSNNTPVVLISTPELITPRTGDSWWTPDGRYVTWQRGHHCMVLMGYDLRNNKVYCADPMMRKGIVGYDLTLFKHIYNLKGKNAMIIDTGSVTVPVSYAKVGDVIRYAGYAHTTSSDGSDDKEFYLDSNTYTVTHIHPKEANQIYGVCIGNIGWVSYDALKENLPYYTQNQTHPDTPTSTLNGVHSLKNGLSSKYLNVDYGKDADGTNIYQWTRDNSNEQKFKLVQNEEYYSIYAMCSNSGNDKMVTSSAYAGANVYLYSASHEQQEWLITPVQNSLAYKIALKSNPELVLTAHDSSNGSGTGTDYTSTGNVYLSKYSGYSSQMWYIE
ncbi:MAG: C39 family peptidase [Oscillospiraceae bacterium]|nr:C39 family peptidase [Oscillospiraceae bacterium]